MVEDMVLQQILAKLITNLMVSTTSREFIDNTEVTIFSSDLGPWSALPHPVFESSSLLQHFSFLKPWSSG